MKDYRKFKIEADVQVVDLRGGTTTQLELIDEWEDKGEIMSTYEIYPYVGGKQVGYMDFIVHDFPENTEENYIEVISIQIDEEYRGLGISTEVYKAFSELYKSKYDGYPLERLFQNPIAEYSFRKAVSNGYVDSILLDNSRIRRDYKDDSKKQQWNDLRGKLPTDVQGEPAKVGGFKASIKTANSTIVDLRDLSITDLGVIRDHSKDDYKDEVRRISATIGNKKVGVLQFSILQNYPGGKISYEFEGTTVEKALYIDVIDVKDPYQGNGIATELYKKFGEIYESEFSGWPVGRYFMNPVAEYAFRKAVSLGWVSENAITEKYITRDKGEYSRLSEKVVDLRGKLPESVQGPQVWANRRDFRKILAAESLEGLNITHQITDSISFNAYSINKHSIEAFLDGEMIGYLKFMEEVSEFQPALEIDYLEVNKNYRGKGVARELYRKFGELYKNQFSGYPVNRSFINPVAEYTFAKAVEDGLVPAEAYNEDHFSRDYGKEETQQWVTELEPKLKDYRNSSKNATLNNNSLDKKSVARIDLRSIIQKSIEANKRHISDYRELKTNHIKDLRKCITEVNKMLTTAAPKIDESEIQYDVNDVELTNIEGTPYQATTISIKYNGDYAGDLIFAVYPEEEKIYIEQIEVWDVYQNLGLAQYLYKKFGELYKQNYSGWTVGRDFQNPTAEAAFKKAIEQGWVPAEALNEDHTKRSYE